MGRPGYSEFRSLIDSHLPLGYRVLFRILFPFLGWRSLPLSVFLPSLLFSIFVIFLVLSLVSRFVERPSDSLVLGSSTPVVVSASPVPTSLFAVVPTPLPGHCSVWCYPGVDCGRLAALNPGCNVVIVEGK